LDGWALINKEPHIAVFGRGLGQKTMISAADFFVLTVISLYLTARSAAAGLFAVGDGGVELFEPDPGGAVGGGAPIADRLRGMVTSVHN